MELKQILSAVTTQRDNFISNVKEREDNNGIKRNVRYHVMKEFLMLRGRNVRNIHKYLTILENDFVMTLPLTFYREMVDYRRNKRHPSSVSSIEKDNINTEQVLNGVSPVIEDVSFLHIFLRAQFKQEGNDPIELTDKSSEDSFS